MYPTGGTDLALLAGRVAADGCAVEHAARRRRDIVSKSLSLSSPTTATTTAIAWEHVAGGVARVRGVCASAGSPSGHYVRWRFAAGCAADDGHALSLRVNRLLLPTNAAQAIEYGLDLDGNGVVNNQFGVGASALANAGFDLQGVMDRVIADGSIILLVDLQTDDLANSTVLSGLRIFFGAQPMPSSDANGLARPIAPTVQRHIEALDHSP